MIGSPISESGVKTKSSKMPPMVLGERSFGWGEGGFVGESDSICISRM